MSKTNFVRTATVIFILIGLGHLYRAVYSLPVSYAGWDIPVWMSWVSALVVLFLAYTGWKHWK